MQATDAERARGPSIVWGEASDGPGHQVVARHRGPNGYTLTALAKLAVVRLVLAGQSPPGFPPQLLTAWSSSWTWTILGGGGVATVR